MLFHSSKNNILWFQVIVLDFDRILVLLNFHYVENEILWPASVVL